MEATIMPMFCSRLSGWISGVVRDEGLKSQGAELKDGKITKPR